MEYNNVERVDRDEVIASVTNIFEESRVSERRIKCFSGDGYRRVYQQTVRENGQRQQLIC